MALHTHYSKLADSASRVSCHHQHTIAGKKEMLSRTTHTHGYIQSSSWPLLPCWSTAPVAAPCCPAEVRITGVAPFLRAKDLTSCCVVVEPCRSRPSNSGPNVGSCSSRPEPGATSSFPSCHTRRPLLIVVVTLPWMCLPVNRAAAGQVQAQHGSR